MIAVSMTLVDPTTNLRRHSDKEPTGILRANMESDSGDNVKRSGRGGQQQQQPALGEEGDFTVHARVYGKVQAKPTAS
jgi:hypothetical protein